MRYRPPFTLDLGAVLGPLRRGTGDPSFRAREDGVTWLTGNTPDGAGTLALRRFADGEIEAQAWGPGADRLLAGVPDLLGASDDDDGFVAHHEPVARMRHRMPGLRLGSTGRVFDALIPAVLEQKVTGYEARRSWRELCRWYGEPAPGPAPEGMRVPPTPRAILSIVDWKWHRAGVDLQRRKALIFAAQVAHRLEPAAELRGADGRALLRKVSGIGVWTASEIAQRAWGDPDAVSFGDFHVPATVGYALVGAPLDDEGMARELAPYAPQRQRAVRYLEAGGFRKPRFGPRMPVRDFREI